MYAIRSYYARNPDPRLPCREGHNERFLTCLILEDGIVMLARRCKLAQVNRGAALLSAFDHTVHVGLSELARVAAQRSSRGVEVLWRVAHGGGQVAIQHAEPGLRILVVDLAYGRAVVVKADP